MMLDKIVLLSVAALKNHGRGPLQAERVHPSTVFMAFLVLMVLMVCVCPFDSRHVIMACHGMSCRVEATAY